MQFPLKYLYCNFSNPGVSLTVKVADLSFEDLRAVEISPGELTQPVIFPVLAKWVPAYW